MFSFGNYFQHSCVFSMKENFWGSFWGIKLAGATPNMVTFRGFFWKFRQAPPSVIYGSPPWVEILYNMLMIGLTISMHFQQFEDLKFFHGEPQGPPKSLVSLALCMACHSNIKSKFDLGSLCMHPPPSKKNPGYRLHHWQSYLIKLRFKLICKHMSKK